MAGVRTYAKKVDITENSSVHLNKHKEENKKNLKLMNNKIIYLIGVDLVNLCNFIFFI
jgi:hypothetical protein